MRRPLACLAVSTLLALPPLPASATELPKRKSGLWEITTRMQDAPAGMPGATPLQLCVDQGSDNLLQERSRRQSSCPGWTSAAAAASC